MMHLLPTIFLHAPEDYMLPCLNKELFGLECPGCGMQRSVQLLLQGEFLAAFTMYPAIYTLIPLFILFTANKVFNVKINELVLMVFGIASVALILINYIIKLIQ